MPRDVWPARQPEIFGVLRWPMPLHRQSSFQPGSNRAEVNQVAETDQGFTLWPEWVFPGETRRCRSSFADISASADMSASKVAREAELPHFGLERCPFHAEAGRGAGRPPITPLASRSTRRYAPDQPEVGRPEAPTRPVFLMSSSITVLKGCVSFHSGCPKSLNARRRSRALQTFVCRRLIPKRNS